MSSPTKRGSSPTQLKRGASKIPGAGSPIYDELVAELGDPTAWPPKGLSSAKHPVAAVPQPAEDSKPARSVA